MPAITLLFGGRSIEHRTSCRMYEHVRERLIEKCPDDLTIANVIGIAPNGKVKASGPRAFADLPSAMPLLAHGKELTPLTFLSALSEEADLTFSLLQGQDGEDGAIQGLSQFFDFPCNFGSPLTAAVSFDKYAQAGVAHGLCGDQLVPLPTMLVPSTDPGCVMREAAARFGNRPVVLKPNAAGGAFKVLALDLLIDEEIERYANDIAPFDDHFLIQERIDGPGLAVGLICRAGEWQWLPVFEKHPPITPSETQPHWLTPRGGPAAKRLAPSDPLAQRALAAAQCVARAFRDESYFRVDFVAGRDGGLRFLGVETRPALSETSIFPVMLAAHGVDLLELIRMEFENQAASRAFRRQRFARIAEWVCANR